MEITRGVTFGAGGFTAGFTVAGFGAAGGIVVVLGNAGEELGTVVLIEEGRLSLAGSLVITLLGRGGVIIDTSFLGIPTIEPRIIIADIPISASAILILKAIGKLLAQLLYMQSCTL